MKEEGGKRIVSYGTSSYGYDIRCSEEFKIFTNINSTIVDPKQFDAKSFVDFKGPVCIIPPSSFTWPGANGSIMPCAAMRRIHLSDLIVIAHYGLFAAIFHSCHGRSTCSSFDAAHAAASPAVRKLILPSRIASDCSFALTSA